MVPHPEYTGALVVRIWVDESIPARLTARITKTSDVSGQSPVVSVASTVPAIEAAVQEWLSSFVDAAGARSE
jgi:hypothetical protein